MFNFFLFGGYKKDPKKGLLYSSVREIWTPDLRVKNPRLILYSKEELKKIRMAEEKHLRPRVCGWKLGRMTQEELNKLYD